MSIFWGLLNRITNNGKIFQGQFFGKTKTKIRSITPYGFFCHPPKNSQLIVMKSINESFYAIAFQDSSIPSLKENEVAIGNFVDGSIIKFDENGNINITCTGNQTITVNGNCTVNVTGNASITAANISATATTAATVTAPTTNIVAATAVNITSPLTTITGALTVTGITTIQTKPFLTHIHSGVTTGPNNTGGVV